MPLNSALFGNFHTLARLGLPSTAPRNRLALLQLLLHAFVFSLLSLAFLFLLETLPTSFHALLQALYSCLRQSHWGLGFNGFYGELENTHSVFTHAYLADV